ncbi:MAG TPA: T9SS type A sorting domain-containing protein [Chitinophagaceae bacterium]|nr:T9SS type A sorting domain-containing protein [Chitinophagaceae bacterium]
MIFFNRLLTGTVLATLLFSCHLAEVRESEPQMDGLEFAMRQEFRMTRDPQLNIIPNERLEIARSFMRSMNRGGHALGIAALNWQERGPSNVGGRTRTIMIDKRDVSGNTVFAGSVSGGIFKTTNFTSGVPNWTPVNDFLANLAITALIQDPVNPNTMYASTGEGWFNVDAVRGNGIFKSTDGGNNWNLLASTVNFEYIQDIIIDNNGNVYASLRNLISNERGVMRSTDGGGSWTQVLGAPLPGFNTGRASDLEVAANGDIYAALGIFGRSVVMKSSFATNGANTGAVGTWTNITPVTPTVTQRTEIVLAPSDGQRVYLLMQDSATSQVLNIFRSTNGGSNWTTLAAPSALNNGSNSQAWFNLIGAVDPNNANTLIVGGLNLARSNDAGDNWTTISNSGTVHVDQHALVYDGSTKLLSGNDGGVYYSTNINATGPAFVNKNNGYNVTQYYGCDVHPSNVNYFLAGAQDNGTQKFSSPGINATINATGGDGGIPHIDQTDAAQLQITASTANNYYRSLNGGATFSSLGSGINNDRGQFINPTDFDDAQNILYAGDNAGSYYCITNLQATPSPFTVNVTAMGNLEVTAIKVDPFTANTIWIAACFGTPAAAPRIIKLSNANTASPTAQVVTNIGVAVNAAVSSIDVDPVDPNHILITLSNYGVISVWESTNGGVVFSPIEGNLPDMPVRWGMFAPASAQLNGAGGGNGGILLATELGVWTTSLINGTSTQWMPNNGGLANVRTDMLKYNLSTNTIAAATHGRGLFTSSLPNVVTAIGGPPANTPEFIRYINSENGRLLIVPGNLQVRTMTLQIFDMAGRKVYGSSSAYRATVINTNGLPAGIYTLKCTGDKKENFIKKFLR